MTTGTRFWCQVLQRMRRQWSGVTESLVLGQRRARTEALAALAAMDLHTTICVHSLVPAEVRELRVRFQTDLALEGLHGRVDVRVLFEAGRGGECLSAFRTSVTAGPDVMRPNVSLEVRWVGEDLQKMGHEAEDEELVSVSWPCVGL